MYTNIQQDATIVSWFYGKITLHVSGTLRAHHQEYDNWIVNFVVPSTLRVVQNRAVGHIAVVEL
jgi:hypothetical protein